jgi:hypothetical protein
VPHQDKPAHILWPLGEYRVCVRCAAFAGACGSCVAVHVYVNTLYWCTSIAVGGEVPGPPTGCIHALSAPDLGSRARQWVYAIPICVLLPLVRDFLWCAARTHTAAHVCTAHTLTQHTHTHTLVRGHVSACPDGASSILRTGSNTICDIYASMCVHTPHGTSTVSTHLVSSLRGPQYPHRSPKHAVFRDRLTARAHD